MRSNGIWFFITSSLQVAMLFGAEATEYKFHGKAWFEGGRIMNATDTLVNGAAPDNVLNLNGNILQSLGAQFTIDASLTDHLEGAFGFGAYKVSQALGKGQTSLLAIAMFQNFLTESRLTYFVGEKEAPTLSFTVGSFPYKYNSDVKNLGLYLLKGPVYPGILMGGFQDFSTDTTKSTMLGLKVHHQVGNFSQDLLLNNEREVPPTLDWSLGYVAKYQAGPLQLGVGANFYRLIPYKSKLETPGKNYSDAELGFQKSQYIEVDSGSTDTTFFTHQGIKLMGMFSLEFQKILGMSLSNLDDLKLYGEVGVIGVKDYGKVYNDIFKRIPAMVGFNIPTGGFLTHLSLEVEYYGALYRNDMARLGGNNMVANWMIERHPIPSPKPVDYSDYGIDTLTGFWIKPDPIDPAKADTIKVKGTAFDKSNQTKDNLKWALVFDKEISKHISIMGQIANDHYRPKSYSTGVIKAEGGTQELFSDPSDWYFMFRMGYFF